MNIELIIFIILASVAVVTSVMMVTRPNPVISAVFLVINFFALAGLYLLLNAQFISVVQVIVYAGAIMVLFLFVLMLLRTESEPQIFLNKKPIKLFAIVITAFVFIQIVYLLLVGSPSKNISPDQLKSINSGTIQTIGKELYTNYIIPFEVAGFLLLAATIGALVLAKKKFD
jgi:NADH-quinone oxidoreductase subunit J